MLFQVMSPHKGLLQKPQRGFSTAKQSERGFPKKPKRAFEGQKVLPQEAKTGFQSAKRIAARDGIRTRASEEIAALTRRLRPTRPPAL